MRFAVSSILGLVLLCLFTDLVQGESGDDETGIPRRLSILGSGDDDDDTEQTTTAVRSTVGKIVVTTARVVTVDPGSGDDDDDTEKTNTTRPVVVPVATNSRVAKVIESGSGDDDDDTEKATTVLPIQPVTKARQSIAKVVESGSGDDDDTEKATTARSVVTTGRLAVVIVTEGSGVTEAKNESTKAAATVTIPSNPDDEDGDSNDNGITFSGNKDSTSVTGSGDGDDTTQRPSNVWERCSDSYLYCWCVDSAGNEVAGTRKFMSGTAGILNCTASSPRVVDSPVTEKTLPIPTTEVVVIEEKPTRGNLLLGGARMPIPTRPPYIVGGAVKVTKKPSKFETPAAAVKPTLAEGANKDGLIREDDVHVERQRILPLFTHPGVLAAVIGGAVVALLCALLLVMFIVYRMRKKDEGSYPLDPDAKPPRLHTYTRAPNKEFYA